MYLAGPRPGDIDHAVRTLVDSGARPLFSATENRDDLSGSLTHLVPSLSTTTPCHRRREQDMDPQVRERLDLPCSSRCPWREGHRLGGAHRWFYEMDY